MFEDPFDGNEDEEDQDHRDQSREQAGKRHPGCVPAIDEPDQAHSNDENQYECTQRQADVGLFRIFA